MLKRASPWRPHCRASSGFKGWNKSCHRVELQLQGTEQSRLAGINRSWERGRRKEKKREEKQRTRLNISKLELAAHMCAVGSALPSLVPALLGISGWLVTTKIVTPSG